MISIVLLTLAIWILALALALLLGWLDRWIIIVNPKPRGWRYWPWAWRFYREHGAWPL
jgi:hypothetical protein